MPTQARVLKLVLIRDGGVGKSLVMNRFIIASLFDAQHERDSVKNKPASLLVVPLAKALSGIPPSWCGRQMAGNS